MEILEAVKTKSCKIIGFSTEQQYNLMLKKIYEIIQPFHPIIIDGGFKQPSNVDAIISVQKSISSMDLNNLKKDDLILSNHPLINHKIQNAIFEILQPFLLKEFKSESHKNNFFTKHIVWIYERINEYDFVKNIPFFLYYGDTTEDDEIHLLILQKMGCRIIFINPRMKDSSFFFQTFEGEEKILPNFSTPETLNKRINDAKEEIEVSNNVIQTVAKKAKEEFSENVYKNSQFVFKPWQFKEGIVIPIYIDAVIEDIKTYWNQDARFREGFEIKVDDKEQKIYVPNFFTKINGVPFDLFTYKEIVDLTISSQLTVCSGTTQLLNPNNFQKEDMFSLMFVMKNNQVDLDLLRNHKLYTLNYINLDTQKLLVNKFNEFSKKFKSVISQIDLLNLLAHIITCKTEYMKVLENFDFPFRVPKLVIYLQDRENFDLINALFVHFLNLIGFDIIIFSPTGAECIEDKLFGNYLNIITMEEMRDNLTINDLHSLKQKEEKKSFLKRIFG